MDTRADTPAFLVAAEDRGGYEAVVTLVDRLLEAEIPWAHGVLEHVRMWVEPDRDTPWLSITHVHRQTNRRRARGHFRGEPGDTDAANTRRILLDVMTRRAKTPIDALVIARDLDHDRRRIRGMRQAVSERPWPFRIALAWSEPEVEAWYIAGFIPTDDGESARLRELTRELGFDPTLTPQQLHSTARASLKDAKRILDHLCAGDHGRRLACLAAPIEHLEERGREAGLAPFLAEVRATLLPLFSPTRRA